MQFTSVCVIFLLITDVLMVCVCRKPGSVTAKTIAVTTQTKPAVPITRAVKISSPAEMATACPGATYVTAIGTAWTVLMKTQ